MSQFYFLSVATLLFGGVIAAADFLSDRLSALSPLAGLTERRGLVLTVGIATAVVGLLKLFLRAPADSIPVAGDLLPAVAGIATGGVLILSQMGRRSEIGPEVSQAPPPALVEYKSPIGLAGIIVGLLHFLFPGAVIL
ncbi:MAG: hypothetical protein ACOC1U_05155 [Spirochaetota bacterium]